MTETATKATVRLVSLGVRWDGKDMTRGFLPESEVTKYKPGLFGAWAEGVKVLVYDDSKSLRQHMSGMPGSIYEVEMTDTTLHSGTARYVGTIPDAALKAEWRAAEMAAKAARDGLKESKSDPLLDMLEPIRTAYKRLPAPARAQLLAKIVHHLST